MSLRLTWNVARNCLLSVWMLTGAPAVVGAQSNEAPLTSIECTEAQAIQFADVNSSLQLLFQHFLLIETYCDPSKPADGRIGTADIDFAIADCAIGAFPVPELCDVLAQLGADGQLWGLSDGEGFIHIQSLYLAMVCGQTYGQLPPPFRGGIRYRSLQPIEGPQLQPGVNPPLVPDGDYQAIPTGPLGPNQI